MQPLKQQNEAMDVLTYGKDSSFHPESINAYGIVNEAGQSLTLACADEVPLFLGVKGRFLFGAKVSQDGAIDESVLIKAKNALDDAKLDPCSVQAILGPSLGFAYHPTDRATLEDLYSRGYRAATKRSEGVDYVDVTVLVYAQLRELGLLPENISLSDYDTFESADILYSKHAGDKETNYVVATLR